MSDTDSDPKIHSQFEEESHDIIAETPLHQRVSALRRSVGQVTARREIDEMIQELNANLARHLDLAGKEQTDARSVLLA